MPVKMRALDAATRILLHDGLPPSHLADNFVSVVFDLIYFVFENQSNDDEDDAEFRQELCDLEVGSYGCVSKTLNAAALDRNGRISMVNLVSKLSPPLL